MISLVVKLPKTRGQPINSFVWFGKLLRTASHLLDDISISVNIFSFHPSTIDILPSDDVWNILLRDQFQNMKRLSIVILPMFGGDAEAVVGLFNTSKFVEQLRSRQTLIVDVKGKLTPYFCGPG